MRNQLLIFRIITAMGQLALLWAGDWFGVSVENNWVWWVPAFYLLVVIIIGFGPERRVGAQWLLWLDLLEWFVFFYGLNGISNPLIWCLMLPIMLSGISQGIVFTWLMTVMSNLSYVLLWWVKPLEHGGMHAGHEPFNAHVIGMWIGFVLISNLLAYITTQLMKIIHQKNNQLLAIEHQRAEDQHIMTMATMATGLAHDLGSPLNSIKLLADELATVELSREAMKEDLQIIDEQIERCQASIREMVDLANNPEYLNSRITDLMVLLKELKVRFCHNHPQVKMTINGDDGQQIITDALLELALLNVFNNSAAAEAKTITLNVAIKQNKIQLQVQDDGLGEHFKQTSGLGIGLKLSRRILRSAGGSLCLHRHPKGAETTITLARVSS